MGSETVDCRPWPVSAPTTSRGSEEPTLRGLPTTLYLYITLSLSLSVIKNLRRLRWLSDPLASLGHLADWDSGSFQECPEWPLAREIRLHQALALRRWLRRPSEFSPWEDRAWDCGFSLIWRITRLLILQIQCQMDVVKQRPQRKSLDFYLEIFEYFASIRSPEGEVFMSPADLMRAVVPVFPSYESTIVKEGSLRGEREPGAFHFASSPLFLLFDTNNDGLISFPEYIFFVTLLSIPDSSFSVAFKMFDLDNNGAIERDEFKKVMALMRSFNRQGACHRNGLRIGLKIRGSVENAGLVEYFFGKDGNERLQHDKFVKFLRDLHDEILRLEFDHYDVKLEGTISAKDFALSMVASADINHINKFLDRVDMLDNYLHLKDMRISFEEFKAFADLRKRLDLLSFAIFSYGKVNGFLAKEDFVRAASHVCGVSLSDNVVDVVFHVFDSNNDGHLSSEEFMRVMQKREIDIRQPTSTSLFRHSFMLP